MKKTISLILAVVMLITIMPIKAEASEITFSDVPKSDEMFRDTVFLTTESQSTDEYNIVIDSKDIKKILKGAKKEQHLRITVSNVPINNYSIPQIELRVGSLKSKDNLRVYRFNDNTFEIMSKKVSYDKDGNLVIKLPKYEGTYYLSDKKNQKEVDDYIFSGISERTISVKKGTTVNLLEVSDVAKKNIKTATLKSNNKKVKVKGTKVKVTDSATIKMKITLKDGGKKIYKIYVRTK